MGRKQEYKETNLEFLKELSSQEGVYALPCGIYYKVLETGTGTVFPNVRSIVTVHYKGSLINGRVFDNSYERNCPEAFRLCDDNSFKNSKFVSLYSCFLPINT